MKRILLVSHCVLNSYCELPQAPDGLRKEVLDTLLSKGISMLQLPCPELTYQGLERASIYPGTPEAEAYEGYCRELIEPILKNLQEYKDHEIRIDGIIGIDTSPSCSVEDPDSIMMKLLLKEMEQMGIAPGLLLDLPVGEEGAEAFLTKLQAL